MIHCNYCDYWYEIEDVVNSEANTDIVACPYCPRCGSQDLEGFDGVDGCCPGCLNC